MTLFDNKYYMLFSWGMHKHNQLGLGDIGLTSSPPRPITYLQDMVFYSVRDKLIIYLKKIVFFIN